MTIPDVIFNRSEAFHMQDELPLESVVHHGRDLIHHINDVFDYNVVDYIEIYQINIGDGTIQTRIRASLTHYNIYNIDHVDDAEWYYHVRFVDLIRRNHDNNTTNRIVNIFNQHVTGDTVIFGNRMGTIEPIHLLPNLTNINIIY